MQIVQNIWSANFFLKSFILILVIVASTCIAYEKKYIPFGTDITIECKSPTPGKPSFSGSFVRRKNTYEFSYLDTVYIQILDFSQNNRGTYRCVSGNKIISVISLELTEKSTSEEIVKFRSVGEDLIMHCKRLTKATHVQWDWISFDSRRRVAIKVENDIIISDNSFDGRLEISSNLTLKLSLVSFRDAGQFKCHFSEQTMGKTFRLITVQVKASPSAEVFHGNIVSLTCSVSHLLSVNDIMLVWAKTTATGSIPVQTRILNNTVKENSVIIEDASKENINWTCLVFHESELVAFLPFQLLYRELATNIYKTSIHASTAKGMFFL
ncbi:uncharacterized protein LOC142150830 [Mixophyes fleayi]|uniref:uncharacterized protein LOC142150830 n=1 Tax=Mixophyes fleayi TaxID=3061075 RepID=UPI003F4DEF42